MAQKLFQFVISIDGEQVDEIQMEPGNRKIGSHERSDIQIDHPDVARVHALIEYSGDAASIIDLGSGRGTMVNGKRVSKHQLSSGDKIQLGAVEIEFKLYAPRAAGRAAGGAARSAAIQETIPSHVLYSRRFLSQPARADETVEVAVVWRDVVMVDETYNPPQDIFLNDDSEGDEAAGKDAVSLSVLHDSMGKGAFKLIDCSSGKPVLQLKPGMTGDLFVGADRLPINAAFSAGVLQGSGEIGKIGLEQNVRARIDFGDTSVFVHRSVKPVLPVFSRITFSDIRALVLTLLLSFFLHGAIIGLLTLMPSGYDDFGSDEFSIPDRYMQVMVEEVVPEEEEMPDWMEADTDEAADEGAIEAGEEGRAGDETAEDTGNRGELGNPDGSTEVSELARAEAREEALNTGALSALAAAGPGSMFGDSAGMYADVVAIGNAEGSQIGASYGTGGLGQYGGGMSTGSAVAGGRGFGVGPMALRGRSSGDSVGRQLRDVSDRDVRQVSVAPGTPAVEGQLDRSIIERVIRQHRREIRACYEAELQRDPDLEGRIVVSFVIDPSGGVARASIGSSTMNNGGVESCITTRVRRWRFPEPRGGGIVRVNYPFSFVAS